MNVSNVLITGGAGFIGSHLSRRLLREGYSISILDSFIQQVHANKTRLPSDLAEHVELISGDVRDPAVVERALTGKEIVIHLAAETGTGQSMYDVARYTDVNIQGTAVLINCIVNRRAKAVTKLVVASSRAIYGEGKYMCPNDGVVYPNTRALSHLQRGQFEPVCPICAEFCKPLPTDELSKLHPSSLYGLTKQVQEQMTVLFAQTLGISAYALRYQNVYGPGQSLQNPYTGVLAIFSGLAKSNSPIRVFEDGNESRDFVYIEDVVDATWRCVRPEAKGVEILNVGSGKRTTINEVVRNIIAYYSSHSPVSITGEFRQGDIRHNFADSAKASTVVGFAAKRSFSDGIKQFLDWAQAEEHDLSHYQQSLMEMRNRGLMYGNRD